MGHPVDYPLISRPEVFAFSRRKKLQGKYKASIQFLQGKKSHMVFHSIHQMTGIVVLLKRSVGIRLKYRVICYRVSQKKVGFVFKCMWIFATKYGLKLPFTVEFSKGNRAWLPCLWLSLRQRGRQAKCVQVTPLHLVFQARKNVRLNF